MDGGQVVREKRKIIRAKELNISLVGDLDVCIKFVLTSKADTVIAYKEYSLDRHHKFQFYINDDERASRYYTIFCFDLHNRRSLWNLLRDKIFREVQINTVQQQTDFSLNNYGKCWILVGILDQLKDLNKITTANVIYEERQKLKLKEASKKANNIIINDKLLIPSTTVSLNEFPDEILFKIFSLLDYESLINAKRVCKHWNRICSDDFFYNISISPEEIAYFMEKANILHLIGTHSMYLPISTLLARLANPQKKNFNSAEFALGILGKNYVKPDTNNIVNKHIRLET